MMECYKIIVYADTIPNFPEEMIEELDLCDLIVPKEIGDKWYEANKDNIITDIWMETPGIDEMFIDGLGDKAFEYWVDNVSTPDMTEDLYEFCMSEKVLPGIYWYGIYKEEGK